MREKSTINMKVIYPEHKNDRYNEEIKKEMVEF